LSSSSSLRLLGAALMAALVILHSAPAARAQDSQQPIPAPDLPAQNPEPAPAPTPPPPPPPTPDPRVDEVDQRTRILERKLELLEEQSAAAKRAAGSVTASDRGFTFKSADNAFVLKLRGVLQVDAREYLADDALSLKDTILVRKARPYLEAILFDLADFRIMPDFGGGTTVLQDAFVDLRLAPWFIVRGGKFKTPVGLERAQTESTVVFPERATPTSLAPNRDEGFELLGNIAGGAVYYEGGVFNGTPDNSTDDADTNRAKDVAGRLFFQPLKSDPYSAFANLGFGIGASTGIERGVETAPNLPSYKTAGQQTFFSYGTNVFARGRRTRFSPQLYYFVGPFGVLAEYIQNRQEVQKGAENTNLKHEAWQVAAYWVLGGRPLFEGNVIDNPFDLKKGTLGALELGLRYNELDIDEKTFANKLYADPDKSAQRARAFGAVLNWDWNRTIRLVVSYEHTVFRGGGPKGGNRIPENVLFQRLQASF
jgi:phosphate-selective porin OprO/OprP